MSHGEQEIQKSVLYDHRPIQLNEDDYYRVCQVPRRKVGWLRCLSHILIDFLSPLCDL